MNPATLVYLSQDQAFTAYVRELPDYHNIELCQSQTIADVLIDKNVALVFVDGAHNLWRPHLLTIKNNAATRRVPVCFASDDGALRAEAVTCGADLALSWLELRRRIRGIISDIARIPDPAILKQLACECRQPLPDLAMQGLRAFNRGEFYQQHDLFEEQWVQTEGPVRDLYRGILQVGVAYYQIEGGNYRGALKMLQRSVQWLSLLPDRCQGFDVERLRRDSNAVRAELQRLGPARLDDLDRRMLKKLQWKPNQSDKT
ncbi:MAG: DUF309 domain-containing protein [Chloroflexi bacterium]|nr:DUF309 domain-containing protein [Chloroflexota bacterium]